MAIDKDVARRAMEILGRDAELDDEVYTPPAAIRMNIDPRDGDGPERADVPRNPMRPSGAGSAALELIEANDNPWGGLQPRTT